MFEAARVSDGINHTSALAGFIAGAVAGIVLIAAVAFCTLTCGFGVALLAGLLAGLGAEGALALGEWAGSKFSSPAGTINSGSSDVFINNLAAAHVQQSTNTCSKHPPLPLIAEGSSNVFINNVAAARVGDHITCGASIATGSNDVHIGGGRVGYLHFDSEVPEWLRTATQWAFALAGLAGGLAAVIRNGLKLGVKSLTPCAAKFIAGYVVGTVVSEAVSKYVVAPVISSIVGHPVQLTTGRKILFNHDETDFVLNGRLPISCSRYYGSNLNVDGMLGLGWMHEWDVSLRLDGDKLIHTDMQGRETPYPTISKGQQIYSPEEQRTLACTDDGRYFLFGLDEIYYEFAKSSNDPTGIYRLCAIEDQVGLRIKFERDDTGKLQQIIGSGGERLQLHYQHPKGRLTAVELLEGGTPGLLAQYRYDAHDQLSAVLNRSNEQTRSFVYAHGLMVEHINALGLICKYKWDIIDGTPRVVEHSNSEGEKYSFGYNVTKRESWATDTFNRTARWHYDQHFQVLESIGFDGQLHVFKYDDAGNLTEMHLPGERKVTLEYDSLSRLIVETDPLGRVTKYEYHKGSLRETCRTLPDGTMWRASYDPRGLLLEQKNPLGQLTKYEYDNIGLATSMIDAKGGRKAMEWNAKGRITAYTDCSNKTTRYEYDENGNLISIINALGQQTRMQRDVNGNLTSVLWPDGRLERYQYDTFGNTREHSNALGHKRQWHRNGRGQVTKLTSFTNRSEEYRYDAHGRLIELVNGNGASYRFEYDKADRFAAQIGVDGIEKRYEYDQAGALTNLTVTGRDDNGITKQRATRYDRDAIGRLLAVHTDTATTEYVYDGLNRLLKAARKPTNAGVALGISNDEVSFEYDLLGQITKEQGANGALAYEYDVLGNLEKTTLPQGQTVSTLRYGSGHTHQISFNDEIVSDIERDDLHREIVRTQGKLTARFGYDSIGRKSWQNAAIGNIDETSGIGEGQGHLWRNYRYGLQNELTGIDDNLRGNTYFQYDPEGRILSSRKDNHAFEHFAWDESDNLQAPSDGRTSIGKVQNNRLMAWQDIRYTYDAFGNVQTKKKGAWREQSFTYDAQDRLIEVSGKTSDVTATTRFSYDALGRRIVKEVIRPPKDPLSETRAKKTHFVWHGMRMVQESTDQMVTNYVYDPNRTYTPLARIDQHSDGEGKLTQGTLYHFHVDQIGTPQEVTDTEGNTVWAGDYEAWGKTKDRQSFTLPKSIGIPIPQNLRFAGQYADESTGLHYNTFRFYDPDIGRYTSQDPIGLAGGINLYAYGVNPTKWSDPWGWAGFIPQPMTDGSVFRGMPEQNLFSPSARDINMFEKSGNMPGFSTFTDGDGVRALTRNGQPMFSQVAEIDTAKLGPNLSAVLDSHKGHVSIMPSEDYLKDNNMTMTEALKDWHAGGDSHPLSQAAKGASRC